MVKPKKITVDSSAHDLVADITRLTMIGSVEFVNKISSEVIKNIRDFHVFDFSRLTEHPKQRELSLKAIELWATVGLIPPFAKCSFVFRGNHSITVAIIHTTTEKFSIEVMLWNATMLKWTHSYSIVFDIRLKSNTISTMEIDDIKLDYKLITLQLSNRTAISLSADKFFKNHFLTSLALLAQKSDAVWVEPAAWTRTDDVPVKNYQRPPPSVSIVKLNTDRILRPPTDDDGSGLTIRPHDRRAHLRRRGNKLIQVRSSKIHGGALESMTKVTQLQRPL